jgi:hypothetical protein
MGLKSTLNAINAKKGVWIYTTEAKQAGRTKELVEGQGTRKVLQFKGVAAPIFIYKMKHPVCEMEDCNQPSYYTDHIIPMSQGGDEWNEENFQALCKSCNGSKTAKQSSKRMLK